jgi:hypothetical protein
MISGNGTPSAKIATKAIAATSCSGRAPSERRPIRTTACSTIARTAAFRPKKKPDTRPVAP